MSSPATPQMPGPSRTLRAVAIIPARLGSTRLARKMLLRETGCFLFEHTAHNAARCAAIERVVVATDAEEVLEAARAAGIEAVSTSPEHPSGTDRVREAYAGLAAAGAHYDVVVGVQGDEPELPPADLERLVGAFADPAVEIATLAAPIADEAEAAAPSVVKVVVDAAGDALYFSRAPIPSRAHSASDAPREAPWRRHLGVYAFRPAALERFATLPRGELERLESLEQLRWLEAGGRMRVVPASRAPRGIDTADDYAAFVARWRAGVVPAAIEGREMDSTPAEGTTNRSMPSRRKGWART